jgi:hypothetical protein
MGAETQNQQLAGGSAARARLAENLKARRRGERPDQLRREGREQRMGSVAGEGRPEGGSESIPEVLAERRQAFSRPEVGEASMFPGERPGIADAPKPPGYEEAVYRRGELTRERDRTGRREEIFRNFQRAEGKTSEVAPGGAVERGIGLFGTPFGGAGQGPRSGIAFGPGRANRMPDQGTPEYAALVERMRSMRG